MVNPPVCVCKLCFFLCIFRSFKQNYFFKGESNSMDMIQILARSNGLKLKKVLMMDLFLTNMQLFASLDLNYWTGVVWIIVMFLSAVWTLILTAPIHLRGSIWWAIDVVLNISKSVLMKKQPHLHLGWPERENELFFNCFYFNKKCTELPVKGMVNTTLAVFQSQCLMKHFTLDCSNTR